MTKRFVLAALLLGLLPLCAGAADFDYSFLEGSLTSVDPDHGSSLTGPTVDGSYALADNVHAFAGYQHVSCCSASQNTFDGGAGWNTLLGEKLGLFVEGEFLSINSTGAGTHTGWGAIGGLRAQLLPPFELDGFVSHTDVNSNNENTIGVRALYELDRNWRVFASFANNSDYNTYMLGVRYAF